jgi:hypothetical protein
MDKIMVTDLYDAKKLMLFNTLINKDNLNRMVDPRGD